MVKMDIVPRNVRNLVSPEMVAENRADASTVEAQITFEPNVLLRLNLVKVLLFEMVFMPLL